MKKKKIKEVLEGSEEVVRAPLPKPPKQVLGIIESRLGHGRLNVICSDKVVRVCRVPGRYKHRLWLREGDIVMVEKWEIGGDKKGDIVYKYRKGEIAFLERQGLLKELGL